MYTMKLWIEKIHRQMNSLVFDCIHLNVPFAISFCVRNLVDLMGLKDWKAETNWIIIIDNNNARNNFILNTTLLRHLRLLSRWYYDV
jgi:hypothetical protein